MPRVAIIDYGLCNLDSIRRAVEICGGTPFVTAEPEAIDTADLLILPGVGAFGTAMANLTASGMDRRLKERVAAGVPMLGICLGMQLLASLSHEGGAFEGLGLVPGTVELLDGRATGARVPHIGWNNVDFAAPADPLLAGIAPGTNFYFVHSYHFRPSDPRCVVATTPYCGEFAAVVRRDNVAGTQFHPEKSQRVGFKLLENYLRQ